MTDFTNDSISAVRKQVDTYTNDKWPWLTQKQRDVMADKLIAQIGAPTLASSVKLATLDINEPTLDFFVMEDASLVRVVPSSAAVIAHQLKALEDAGHTVTPELKLNTARSVAAMSDDERLAALPYNPDDKPDAAEAVAPAPIKPTSNGGAAMSDDEISQIVGKPVHLLLASDRARILSAQKHVPDGKKQNATDQFNLSNTGRELSPTERITAFRIAQQQKRAS